MVATVERFTSETQIRPSITRPPCPWGGYRKPQESTTLPQLPTEQEPLADRVAKLPFPAQQAFESMTITLGSKPKIQEKVYGFLATVEERYILPRDERSPSDDFLTADPEKAPDITVTERLHKTQSGRMALNGTEARLSRLQDGQKTEVAYSLGAELRLLLKGIIGEQTGENKRIYDSLAETGRRYFGSVVSRMEMR